MPTMLKESVISPLLLSIFTDQPPVPPLGALMVHGPMTKGLAAVPFPLVTQPQLVKPASEVMVIAACPPVPAEPGTAGRANRTPAVRVDNRTSSRRIWVLPYIPSRQFSNPRLLATERSRTRPPYQGNLTTRMGITAVTAGNAHRARHQRAAGQKRWPGARSAA